MNFKNKHNLPKSLCRALMGDDYDLNKIDKSIRIYSATGLLKPVRQVELEKRHWDKLEQDVSEGLNRLMGTGIHLALGMPKEQDDIISEKRMYLDLNTSEVFYKVSDFKDKTHTYIAAKPDIYDVIEKTIEDFKVTSVWSIVFMNNKGGGKQSWEEQLNIYAYVMRKAGYPVEKLKIIAILRDWMKSKAVEFDYPQLPFQIIELELWDDAKTEQFIKEKVEQRILAETVGDDALPICTPEERWGSDTKYAVMQKGRKSAVRVFDKRDRAEDYMKSLEPVVEPVVSEITEELPEEPVEKVVKAPKYHIQERHGEDKKCVQYCGVLNLCSYYRETYGEEKDG